MRIAAVALSVAAGWPIATPATGTQVPAGQVNRIAVIIGFDERKIDRDTSLVQVRRPDGSNWINAGPDTPLFYLDSMSLQQYIDAQVRMRGPTWDGVLTFLPELINEGGRLVFRSEISSSDALYNITEPPNAHVGVNILRGALVVEWNQGRLEILAAGVRLDVLGTRVAVAVDSTGDSGFVYLENGTVFLPDFPGTAINAGDVFSLQRGLPPVRVEPTSVPGQDLDRAVDFNHSRVWGQFRPFYLKPLFYVPAAIVASGVGTWLLTRNDGDHGGIVIIRIPFD